MFDGLLARGLLIIVLDKSLVTASRQSARLTEKGFSIYG